MAESLPLDNISGLLFSLNIVLVFEALPSQRNVMFSLFNQCFQHDSLPFLAVFLWFLSHFSLLVSWHKTAVVLVAKIYWIASTLCKVCIHSWSILCGA